MVICSRDRGAALVEAACRGVSIIVQLLLQHVASTLIRVSGSITLMMRSLVARLKGELMMANPPILVT